MTHTRSQEWLTLIDAANEWQQSYDLLLYWEGIDPDSAKAADARAAEQVHYDYWTHCLVQFEASENRKRVAR